MEFYCKIKVFSSPSLPQYSLSSPSYLFSVSSPDPELDLLTTEDGRAEFRAAVSNMNPDQVFSYRARQHSIRSQDSPSRR